MNRLKKEMISRGIVYENDGDYEEGRSFIAIVQGKYILTMWGCNVLPTELHLFDRDFRLVATQDLFPEKMFFRNGKTWHSRVFTKEDRI